MLGERRLEPAAAAVLAAHAWPGNLRELRTVLQESVTAAGEAAIQREHIPRRLRERLGFTKPAAEAAVPLDATLEDVERKLIQAALRKAAGNVTQAAVKLGLPRNRLIRRIEALGITVPTPA